MITGDYCLRVWSEDLTFSVTKTEESVIGQKRNQEHACRFFDIYGIIHSAFITQGHTVNADFYCSVLKWLREDISRKWPSFWRYGNWML